MNKNVLIVLHHSLDRSTRATKVINFLNDHDFSVTLLYWDRFLKVSRSEKKEVRSYYKTIILKLPAPWGCKSIFLIPIWWGFIFFQVIKTDCDIIHACEFASAPPAIIAAKLKRKPVIYEIMDTFADTMILPDKIRYFLINIDKLFMRLSSALILADESQIDEIEGIPNRNVIAIYDSPSIISNINLDKQENNIFTIFYAGLLYSGKKLNLDNFFAAIQYVEGIRVIIAGYGDMIDEIKCYSRKMPNKVEFIGEIDRVEVLEKSVKADLLFVLRDPVLLVNKYICGSKVLEAMMCGTPILVNKGTSTANKVLEENCGVVVDATNIEDIRDAIIKLRDNPELCKELGANGRRAYVERYSWEIMEQRLIAIYRELIKGRI